jgi:hypothetical protein
VLVIDVTSEAFLVSRLSVSPRRLGIRLADLRHGAYVTASTDKAGSRAKRPYRFASSWATDS